MIDRAIRRLHFVYYAGIGLLCISLVIEISTALLQRVEGSLTDAQLAETASHLSVFALLLALGIFAFRPAIAHLKAIHTSVAKREAYLNRVISTAIEGYAEIEPKNLRYIEVNDALCAMLGYTRAEMIGKTPIDFCAPESAKVIRAQASTISQTNDRQYQVVMRHKDGSNVYTQYNANTVWNKDGDADRAFAFITNVSKLKHVQLALAEARDKAEQATALKDKFVSLIAHDLRNPIGAVRGYTELMLMDLNKTLDDDQKEALTYIYNQCNELLELINDLLDLSRLQAGSIDLDRKFGDAHFITENIVRRVELQAQTKNIELVNAVPVHTRIYADHVLLGQVLQNLISNAIKFSPESTVIRIYVPDDTATTLAVEDKGVGMNAQAISKLFNLEEKQSTTGTAGEKGSGFGLPLSRQIMQAHDGDIRVISEEGQGSTFFAELPEAVPTVLVIDDDNEVRSQIRALLEASGVNVVEAENGLIALKHIKESGQPDLIVLDIQTPVMDGFEFLQTLKKTTAEELCPVIALTEDSNAALRDQCLGSGASDFTQKPIVEQDFMPRVRHFIA